MPMSVEDILNYRVHKDNPIGAIDNEVVAEKASSLGHHGRLVEGSLMALKALPRGSSDPAKREAALNDAAYAVWAFLIQRELCGLRDQKEIIRFYEIPTEVLNRLGAVTSR